MLLRLIEKDKRGAFMRGKIWSEQETYIAFLLYCQIPFGQIDKRNPKIIELANLLDRTPSSVGMKLCNFAANDPLIQARGVKGLQNCSIKDKQVFEAFKSDWDKNLDDFDFHLAAEEIYQFFWHEFCDQYWEEIKSRLR